MFDRSNYLKSLRLGPDVAPDPDELRRLYDELYLTDEAEADASRVIEDLLSTGGPEETGFEQDSESADNDDRESLQQSFQKSGPFPSDARVDFSSSEGSRNQQNAVRLPGKPFSKDRDSTDHERSGAGEILGAMGLYKAQLYQHELLERHEERALAQQLSLATTQLRECFLDLGFDPARIQQLASTMDVSRDALEEMTQESTDPVQEADTAEESGDGGAGQGFRHDVVIRFAEQLLKAGSEELALPESLRAEMKFQLKQARSAFRALVEANLRLVVFVAKKFRNRGVDFSDLVQEGNIGLLRAVARFDGSRGFKFSTYAYWWILQSIQHSLGDQRSLIRYPSTYYQDLVKVHAAANRVYHRDGRREDYAAIAELAGMSEKKVRQVFSLSHHIYSADAPTSDDGSTSFIDFFEDDSSLKLERRIDVLDDGRQVESLLRSLTERERKVIRMRYGVGVGAQYSLQQISEAMGCTRERVRQIEKGAISKLRSLFEDGILTL